MIEKCISLEFPLLSTSLVRGNSVQLTPTHLFIRNESSRSGNWFSAEGKSEGQSARVCFDSLGLEASDGKLGDLIANYEQIASIC